MIHPIIREYVLEECKKPTNAFGSAFFDQHILIVKDYANRLANLLGADREIVETAAYLHDISAIQDFGKISQHATFGAEIASDFLGQNSYAVNKISEVQKCILTHSAPIQKGKGTLEEICLSNADAISQIINPSYWLYYAFSIRKFDFEQGYKWYSQRIDSNWNGLIEEAKELIKDKYLFMRNSL